MPKPAHTRVTFEGVVGAVAAPLERWSFNVNFPADVLPNDGGEIVNDAVALDAKTAYADDLASRLPMDVVLTKVKVSRVNADGHVDQNADGTYTQGEWIGTVVGILQPQPVPLQTALCVSLKTFRAGPTGKGRFFLPWPGKAISPDDKRIDAASAQDLANACVNFLNDLAVAMTFAPQVVSSKGYMSEVVGVRIGRVPDTMRSRREDLIEGYVDAFLG